MKLAPPDDWQGQWECYQVEWPSSPLYRAILLGFLSYLTRGRAWDEKNGSIRDAQKIGREIFERNYPLVHCGDDSRQDDTGGVGWWPCENAYGDITPCKDEIDMSGCGGSGLPIKVENGLLYWWSCCQWVLVGAVGSGSDTEEPDDEEPGSGIDDWNCRKAQAIGQRFYEAALAALDAMTAAPWNMSKTFRQNFPDWEIGVVKAFNFLIEYAIADTILLEFFEITFTPTERDRLICNWAKVLDSTTNKISEAEYSAMKSVLKGMSWGEVEKAFLQDLFDVIGRANFSRTAAAGTADDGANCDCPEVVLPFDELPGNPGGLEWHHDFQFKTDDYGFVGSSGYVYGSGVGFSSDAEHTSFQIDMPGGTTTSNAVTYIYVELQVAAGFQWEDLNNAFHYKIGANAEMLWAETGDSVVSGGGVLKLWKRCTGGQFLADKFVLVQGESTIPQYTNVVSLQRVAFGGVGSDPWPDAPDIA